MRKLGSKKIILCCISLLLFIAIAVMVIVNKTTTMDDAIYDFIICGRCPLLDQYFIFITHLADTGFIVLLVVGFLLITRDKYGLLLVVSAINSSLMNMLLKHIFVRTRPDHLRLIKQGGYSFPSGHAMIAVCVYGYLLYLVILEVKNKYLKYTLSTILTILIISIGISRIYVGVHYPSDVIGGYLVGIIEVVLVMEVLCFKKVGE